MKFMRLAACAVAFAGMVYAEDMDIKALQAKLAAQEARLNDLQAKMGSGSAATPANITSLRKNAKVTIGGDIDVRYIVDNYDAEIDLDGVQVVSSGNAIGAALDGWRNYQSTNKADLFVDTADLRVQVDVNENFDAFMRIGSHDNGKNTGVVRDAWFRWKNICNSGWGVLIGRDGLKFGMIKPVGMFDAWMQDGGSRSGWAPAHLNHGVSRTTQINPYWQSQDGKFRFDLSLFQTLETRNEGAGSRITAGNAHTAVGGTLLDGNGTVPEQNAVVAGRVRDISEANYGLGTGALKLTWKPTEDWTIVAAVANMYADGKDGWRGYHAYNRDVDGTASTITWGDANASNNTAFHFGITYKPAVFCQKLTVWGQVHKEYNTGFVKDRDYFSVNGGLAYAFTDKVTAFAMGDYVTSNRQSWNGWLGDVSGWRSYLGVNYNVGYGVNFEAGWSHEQLKFDRYSAGVAAGAAGGNQKGKISGDTVYGKLAFSF